jgi:6-phosphogluconolactonase (cycloisomerase 2 family)
MIQPDGKYVVVSNRANNLANVEECDITLQNCKLRPSDTLTTFKPNSDGTLENVQAWSAGGSSPRAFDFNRKGDLIAVGLDHRLVILQRDVETGKIGQIIIDVIMGDQVTSIVWDEIKNDQAVDNSKESQEFLELT